MFIWSVVVLSIINFSVIGQFKVQIDRQDSWEDSKGYDKHLSCLAGVKPGILYGNKTVAIILCHLSLCQPDRLLPFVFQFDG